MSLRIEILPPGKGSQRVAVEGRLDTHTYEDLDEALAPLLTRQLHSLVLDMVKAVPLNEIFSSTAEADAYLDLMQRRVLEAGEDED